MIPMMVSYRARLSCFLKKNWGFFHLKYYIRFDIFTDIRDFTHRQYFR